MFGEVQIAPSLLSADFLNLERDVRLIEQGSPEWLHVDVMDGHFVPNLTIGPPIIKALKNITNIKLDVHLMIENPVRQLDWYLDAGADLVTLHVESNLGGAQVGITATDKIAGHSVSVESLGDPAPLIALIDRIHAAGARAGISLNPDTPARVVEPFIGYVDLILVMSVHPGFGGQSFIESSLAKLAQIAELARTQGVSPVTRAGDTVSQELARTQGVSPLIEIDGGINEQTAPLVVAQGADVLVAGNAIFGDPDPLAALRRIRMAARQ